jgi:hypothetical protein
MTRSHTKTIAALFALAGAGLLAWAGLIWFRGGNDVKRWNAKLAEQQSQLKTTRTEVQGLSLKYQAFMKSLPAVPDSVRMASGKVMRETERHYESNIRRLEMAERDLELDINRSKRKIAEAKDARRRHAVPFAGAGAGAWLCALVFVGLSRRSAKPLDANASPTLF